jgi:hypothetical protein
MPFVVSFLVQDYLGHIQVLINNMPVLQGQLTAIELTDYLAIEPESCNRSNNENHHWIQSWAKHTPILYSLKSILILLPHLFYGISSGRSPRRFQNNSILISFFHSIYKSSRSLFSEAKALRETYNHKNSSLCNIALNLKSHGPMKVTLT